MELAVSLPMPASTASLHFRWRLLDIPINGNESVPHNIPTSDAFAGGGDFLSRTTLNRVSDMSMSAFISGKADTFSFGRRA